MTDSNYTALLLIIDRSGSMLPIRDDMVGGLTSMLAEQADDNGRLTVDILTFDDVIEKQCTFAEPADVIIALEPRGSTALYDAVGLGVVGFGRQLSELSEDERPGVVQVVVVTDGLENASREYTASTVKALVEQQINSYGWDFVYLGANQDAVLTGAALGFDAGSSLTYAAEAAGVSAMKDSLSRYVKDVRRSAKQEFTVGERAEATRGK